MQKLSDGANNALLLLARRKHSIYCTWWFDVYSKPTLYLHKCFVCKHSFEYVSLNDHGMIHLKEYNLLPFI